jgi:hypothetical protein
MVGSGDFQKAWDTFRETLSPFTQQRSLGKSCLQYGQGAAIGTIITISWIILNTLHIQTCCITVPMQILMF